MSWLYRPLKTGDRKPALIVIPYPGEPAYAPVSPEDGVTSNVQLMTAAGYAVLIPSLPRPDRRGEPAIGMADDILAAVDAAASLDVFDPNRVVLWGHSFGAFAAVAAATQSDRFSAVIAANGPYNLLSAWGQFSLTPSLSPADGLPVRSRAGWVETGQGVSRLRPSRMPTATCATAPPWPPAASRRLSCCSRPTGTMCRQVRLRNCSQPSTDSRRMWSSSPTGEKDTSYPVRPTFATSTAPYGHGWMRFCSVLNRRRP